MEDAPGTYLLEIYLPRSGTESPGSLSARARAAAARSRRRGLAVRFQRSLFVPEDETCFLVFAGPSREAVAEAGALAGLRFERVLRAEESGGGPTRNENERRTR